MKGNHLRLATISFISLLLFNVTSVFSQSPFKISGEIRTRGEGRDNADFNSERLDGTVFVLQRTRLGIAREFENGIDVFVQIQDSRLWGEEGSGQTALKAADLHQAYFEADRIVGLPIRARIGRQILSFGSERLIGKSDWNNMGRAFDAARIIIGDDMQDLNLWLAQVRDFNAPAIGRNQEFGGAYFSSKKLLPGVVEAYSLFFFDERNYDSLTDLDVPIERSESGSNHLTLWTFGGRAKAMLLKSWQFEIEGAYQLGNRGPLDIRAYGIALESSYIFPAKWQPGLFAGYTFGSGDGNSKDTKVGTFTYLFPTGHDHNGAMDYASWSNISALHFAFMLQPAKNFDLGAKLFFLSLADDNDAFYRVGGYQVGSPAEIFRLAVPGAATAVGKEIDFFAKLLFRERINILFGVSRFFVGEFLEDTGGLRADDSYFGYFSLSMVF